MVVLRFRLSKNPHSFSRQMNQLLIVFTPSANSAGRLFSTDNATDYDRSLIGRIIHSPLPFRAVRRYQTVPRPGGQFSRAAFSRTSSPSNRLDSADYSSPLSP